MDDKKFEIILDSLLNRTQSEELNWKSTASPSKYLLVLNDSSIVIDQDKVSSGGFIFIFEFKNKKGETVEAVDVNFSAETRFSKASRLYDLARQKALNSNDTIDKIIQQLSPESLAA